MREPHNRCPTCGRLIPRHTDCEHCVRVAADAATDAARERAWLDWMVADARGPQAPPPPPPEEWAAPEGLENEN